MGLRLFGCGTFLGGLALVYVSFHTDELGIGEFEGVGEGELLLTLLGVIVAGVGTLMVFSAKDPRNR